MEYNKLDQLTLERLWMFEANDCRKGLIFHAVTTRRLICNLQLNPLQGSEFPGTAGHRPDFHKIIRRCIFFLPGNNRWTAVRVTGTLAVGLTQ